MGDAIGMTYLGGNGFTFIDNIAKAAQSVDQLEWIVAHNVAHELMIAFGVGENYDKTGNYIDAERASWSMITGPSATFSQGAAQALLGQNFQTNTSTPSGNPFAQQLGPNAVPEPTSASAWALGALALGLIRLRSARA
jgi:hypothetical protein